MRVGEAVEDVCPVAPRDQPLGTQDTQPLGDGRKLLPERGHDLAAAHLPGDEQVQDAEPGPSPSAGNRRAARLTSAPSELCVQVGAGPACSDSTFEGFINP